MTDQRIAGTDYAHRFCRKCDVEINAADLIVVDEDGDSDGEGGFRNLTTVSHVECPKDAA